MTTFVIDAELVTDDVFVTVTGLGTYTVDDLPTKSELDGEFFVFPAGLVVAGGKEVWDYPDVVPIDDYAALGPREAPGETMATPWPEDEMVSADMHFNLGMHVQQLAKIAEDHELRLRELEAQIQLLLQLIMNLIKALGENLEMPGPEVECNVSLASGYTGHVKNPATGMEFGYDAPDAIISKKCNALGSEGKNYLLASGNTADGDWPLNQVISIPITMNVRTVSQVTDGANGWARLNIANEDSALPYSGVYYGKGIYRWFSTKPGGDPAPKLQGGVLVDGVVDNSGKAGNLGAYAADDLSAFTNPNLPNIMLRSTSRKWWFNVLASGFNNCGKMAMITTARWGTDGGKVKIRNCSL